MCLSIFSCQPYVPVIPDNTEEVVTQDSTEEQTEETTPYVDPVVPEVTLIPQIPVTEPIIPIIPIAPVIPTIEIPIVPIIVQRDDFNINLTLEDYVVGSRFNFSGAIQNKTNKDIFIDNSERSSLEYKLMKGEEVILSEKLDALKLTLYSTGFIETNYKDNKLKTKLWGVKLETGKIINVPITMPFPLVISTDYTSLIFKDAGKYKLITELKYKIANEIYDMSFSKEFEVKQ